MGRLADKVFTAPGDVERMHQWVRELPINGRVRVHLDNGEPVEGVVIVTPTVQVFNDASGTEGINGTVKLEDPQQPGWSGLVWLGNIVRIEHLDSVAIGTTKA
jgi:hypothetical protein